MGTILKNGIAYGASNQPTAAAVPYSNTSSGLTATNVQSAIDEEMAKMPVLRIFTVTATTTNSGAFATGLDLTKYAIIGAQVIANPSGLGRSVVAIPCSYDNYLLVMNAPAGTAGGAVTTLANTELTIEIYCLERQTS